MRIKTLLCALPFALLVLAAPAWAAKVQVCHVPPGDPSNFHTITISDNALQAHLAHGDLTGPCSAHCSQLCDDGNACTIDACDANEHCLATHPPVNCDDGNLCTIDSCNPATGCSSTPKVCQDGNLCTVDACDPLTGSCVFPPVVCPSGQTCNAGNGNCESSVTCPCNDPAVAPLFAGTVAGQIAILACDKEPFGIFLDVAPSSHVFIDTGNNRCGGFPDTPTLRTTPEQTQLCVQLLEQAANSQGVTCN